MRAAALPARAAAAERLARVARAYAPVAGQLVVSWATCVHPAPVGFRWHLVRSRPLGGGVSDGLASGSRAGAATPDEPDARVLPRAPEPTRARRRACSVWRRPGAPGPRAPGGRTRTGSHLIYNAGLACSRCTRGTGRGVVFGCRWAAPRQRGKDAAREAAATSGCNVGEAGRCVRRVVAVEAEPVNEARCSWRHLACTRWIDWVRVFEHTSPRGQPPVAQDPQHDGRVAQLARPGARIRGADALDGRNVEAFSPRAPGSARRRLCGNQTPPGASMEKGRTAASSLVDFHTGGRGGTRTWRTCSHFGMASQPQPVPPRPPHGA